MARSIYDVETVYEISECLIVIYLETNLAHCSCVDPLQEYTLLILASFCKQIFLNQLKDDNLMNYIGGTTLIKSTVAKNSLRRQPPFLVEISV